MAIHRPYQSAPAPHQVVAHRPPPPPWNRPEGVPLAAIGPFDRRRGSRDRVCEENAAWLAARKALWRAIAVRKNRPWPADNPAFEPEGGNCSDVDDDEDNFEDDPGHGRFRPPPPPWNRPLGVPDAADVAGPFDHHGRGGGGGGGGSGLFRKPYNPSAWLRARQQLWRTLAARNHHPWPSDNPDFVPEEDVDAEESQDPLAKSHEWLSWLHAHKTHWQHLKSRRLHGQKLVDNANESGTCAGSSSSSSSSHQNSNGNGNGNGDEIFSWFFLCSCGIENAVDFDDGTSQWECPRCHKWAHAACARAWHKQAGVQRRVTQHNYRACFACTQLEECEARDGGSSLLLVQPQQPPPSFPTPPPSLHPSASPVRVSTPPPLPVESSLVGVCAAPASNEHRSTAAAAAALVPPPRAPSERKRRARGRAVFADVGGKQVKLVLHSPPSAEEASNGTNGHYNNSRSGNGHGSACSDEASALVPSPSVHAPLLRPHQAPASATLTAGAALASSQQLTVGGRWLSFVEDLPDDVLASILQLGGLPCAAQLLLVSLRWANKLKRRQDLWRVLCWSKASWRSTLPSRPRKPWYSVFVAALAKSEKARRAQSDDLLRSAHATLKGGDQVASLRKLVDHGMATFAFDPNHQSGVLFERNSLLNLAVLLGRPKAVHYLVVECRASPNLQDHGGFSALMGAAWRGDLGLVRLLLHFGGDPTLRGHSHYSGGIKVNGPWHNAAGWAEVRKHEDVAALLREWESADPLMLAKVKARAVAAALASSVAAASNSASSANALAPAGTPLPLAN